MVNGVVVKTLVVSSLEGLPWSFGSAMTEPLHCTDLETRLTVLREARCVDYAKMSVTTLPKTSVRRKSRPACR